MAHDGVTVLLNRAHLTEIFQRNLPAGTMCGSIIIPYVHGRLKKAQKDGGGTCVVVPINKQNCGGGMWET